MFANRLLLAATRHVRNGYTKGSQQRVACLRNCRLFGTIPTKDRDDNSTDIKEATTTENLFKNLSFYASAVEAAPPPPPDPLLSHLLQSLIDYGVPTFFLFSLVAAGTFMWESVQRHDAMKTDNPVADLYSDLYGTDSTFEKDSFLSFLRGRRLPRNAGVPRQTFLNIVHINQRLLSYDFSLNAATQSKASASAVYRQKSLQRALGKALSLPTTERKEDGEDGLSSSQPTTIALSTAAMERLEKAESEFLEKGQSLVWTLQQCRVKLTKKVCDAELKRMGLKTPLDLYGHAGAADKEFKESKTKKTSNSGSDEKTDAKEEPALPRSIRTEVDRQVAWTKLQDIELKFLGKVIQAAGPQHGPALSAVLLGNAAGSGGSEGLLLALQDRPLKALLLAQKNNIQNKDTEDQEETQTSVPETTTMTPRVFVTKFRGGAFPELESLREKVTAICRTARPGLDKVVVVLQTSGGTVTGYGLAAGQLLRFKDKGLELTVAVEQIAASGGYMMAAVADRILLSPFGALGSIGVVTEMPNLHNRLKREGVDVHTVTAGRYKRTMTPFKEVTEEDKLKTKEELEGIWNMFKSFVAKHRPQLDLDKVATGEVWFGTDALEKNLCDEIQTSDDLLVEFVDKGYDVFEVQYAPSSVLGGFMRRQPRDEDFSDGAHSPSLVKRSVEWLLRTAANELGRENANGGMETQQHHRYLELPDSQHDYRYMR